MNALLKLFAKPTTTFYCILLLTGIIFPIEIFGQLSGTYTIGGTSPNYSTITAAVNALNSSGVSGAVNFHIRQGTYTERLSINSISGSNSSRKVTFRPDPNNTTGVTIQYTTTSSSNYVIRLNGAKNVAFKNLNLRANGSSYSTVFELRGLNDNIEIDSCKLELNKTISGSSIYRCGVYELSGSGNRTSGFSLTNSEVIGGSYGVYAYGYSSGTWMQKNWEIKNNDIRDWDYTGVYLYYYFDTVDVSNNDITQRSTSTISSYGVYGYYNYRIQYEANKVVMASRNVSGGIFLNRCYGTSTRRSPVANNMISMTSTSKSGTRYGLYTNYCNYLDVVYNSLYNQEWLGYTLYARYGTGNVYRNNAISNLSTNSSAYCAYYLGSSTRSNNCYWAPSGITSNLTLGTGSIIKNPFFVSSTNLHASGIDLNGAGVTITGITTDFDGQTRSTSTPDIGADEFTPPANDAGLSEIVNSTVCSGSNSIQVRLRNYGSSTLTSARINWSVQVNTGSAVSQTSYNWTGSLLSGKDTVVTIGNYSMTATNSYTINAWSSLPNNSSDGNSSNDTSSSSFVTSLSGIYTIGGTSPSYSTIQAAATDLANKGVCGPVIFRIRAGSYNEAVTINTATGASATNTITFTKDPASTGDVVWYRFGNPLIVRNSQHVIIDGLTIETRSSYNVISFSGLNNNITIKKCTIRGLNTSSSSRNYSLVYSFGQFSNRASYITIDSNRFVRGSAAIYLQGYTATAGNRTLGIKITNNQYDSSGYYGFYLQYQDSMTISNNSINDRPGIRTTYYGIYSSSNYNFNISSNQIKLRSGATTSIHGLWLASGGGTSGNHSQVLNNFISIDRGNYGIYHSQVNYVDYYFNTIQLTGNNTNSYAGYFYYGTSYLKNNIFSNEAGGYVIYARFNSHIPLCDYNDMYTSSTSRFAYGQGGYRTTFSQWKIAMTRDQNSVSVNPYFRSATSPIPNNGALNGAGDAITGVTKDINGVTRGSTPDIGCVEFTPSNNDAGIAEVLDNSVCPGSSPVKVRLRNNGNNTLTQARVQWNVKTNAGSPVAQTAYNWSGSLASYTDTVISLGNFTFVGSNTYQITAYTDQANNTTDPVKSNDTAVGNSLQPAMSGTYTVGGVSPDYSTLQLAINALQTNGVCGPVTINVRGGTYTGLNSIGSISGTDSTNDVTIQSDPSTSRATLSHSYYPIYLNSSSYINFHNLTLRTTGASSVVYFNGNNHHIAFTNDSLIGYNSTSTSRTYSVIYDHTSTSIVTKHLTVENCTILNGSHSIHYYGSTGTRLQTGLKVRNNTMLNFSYMGVYAVYASNALIEGNYISDRNFTTSPYGINVLYGDSARIIKNDVQLKAGYGISIQRCYGNTSQAGALVANNFISFKDTVNTYTCYGIYDYSTSYADIWFNSVYLSKGSSFSTCVYGRYGSNNDIRNNNLVNNGTGYAQYILSAGNIATVDYNNLRTSGTNLAYYLGNRTTLAAWRSGTGKATNSVSIDPQFVSQHDLHVQNAAFDNSGVAIAGVTHDIDGDLRGSVPDIGADEFQVYNRDASIVGLPNTICVGSNVVNVRVRNLGLDSLVSTTINWSVAVNGGAPVAQTAASFSGLIRTGKDSLISLGNYTFSAGSSYTIKAYLSGFNGSTDQNIGNDTLEATISPSMSGWYSVGSTSTDDWSTIDSAISALEANGVCGPTTIYVKSGNYIETVTIDSIKGTSPSSVVTILGDTATRPNWYGSSTIGAINFNGVKHVKVSNFKLVAGSTTSRVIGFGASNKYLEISDNELAGAISTSTSFSYSIIYNVASLSSQQHYISIKNNKFTNGSYSLYWAGYNASNREIGNVFSGNQFLNNNNKGIYIYYQDSITIDSNHIQTKAISLGCQGIDAHYCQGMKITKNRIEVRNSSSYGINLRYSSGTSTNYNEISNNFIGMGGTYISYGIYANYSNYCNVYHNSIHVYNTHGSSYCYYNQWSNFNKVKNNSMVNSGNGRVVYVSNRSYYEGDYNNFYTTGGWLGRYSSSNATSLASWRTLTLDDQNSVNTNPSYKDTFDLHTVSAVLNNAGTPLGILTDIDGDTRSTSAPDIGADEYSSTPNDMNLVELISGACEGTQPVQVLLKNSGTSTLTSGRIKWTISTNGGTPVAQTDFVVNFTMATQADTIISLGNATFTRGSYYDILVYVDSVNGVLDGNKVNDTLNLDSAYAAMSGVYTVGGSSPDFSTVSAAASALSNRGVCGKVFINLRSGSYNDRFHIPTGIVGTDTANTVTIQSDTGVVGKAEIYHNYQPMGLWMTDHVIIKNLRVRTTGRSSGIYLSNSGNIKIEECDIDGMTDTTLSHFNYASVYVANGLNKVNSNISINDNQIRNGSYGVYVSSSSYRSSNVNIEGNSISDYITGGIHILTSDTIKVLENTISNRKVAVFSGGGIYLSNSRVYEIAYNKIDLDAALQGATQYNGIYLSNADGFSNNYSSVYNNFIAVKSIGSVGRGVTAISCSYLNLDHNSIHVYGTHSGSGGLVFSSNTFYNVRNNSVVNSGGGLVYTINGTKPNVSNYNNLYTTGVVFGAYFGNRSTFAAWRTATNTDANSISFDPDYFTDKDLHTGSASLNGAASNLAAISDDIDGDTRAVNRDIGADEYTPLPRDIALSNVDELYCPGLANVKVSFKNVGSQTVTSARINWWLSTNGSGYIAQTPAIFSGSVNTANSHTMNLGSVNFLNGNTYSILAVVDQVNNANDSNAVNDTIRYVNLSPALTGTYTIGSSGDFKSFSSADSALDAHGVCGAVVFEVEQGNYAESVTLGDYKGSSSSNTITFVADTANTAGVFWSDSLTPLRLVNASYLTFKDLNITNTGSANAVYIGGDLTHVSFENNTLTGSAITSSSYLYAVVLQDRTGGGHVSQVRFKDNILRRGSYGLWFQGSLSAKYKGFVLDGNDVSGYRYMGMQISAVDSVYILNNTFKNLGNYIGVVGMNVLNADEVQIRRNKIDHTKQGGRTALYMSRCTGTVAKPVIVSNNFFATNISSFGNAVEDRYGSYVYFYFNSIHAVGSGINSKALYCYYGSNNRFQNNNIINSAGGYAVYAHHSTSYPSANYNNLYSSSSTRLAYRSGVTYANLAAWKTATNRDMNSVSGDPFYKTAGDLHALGIVSNNSGTPISLITTDIDGELRSSTPDIGADEFTASPNDAGIDSISGKLFCSGSNNVEVSLTNFGTDTLKSVTINWSIGRNYGTASLQGSYSWTGALPTGASATVNVGNYNFSPDTIYQIFAHTSAPNGLTDGFANNDSSVGNPGKTAMSGTYVVDHKGGADYVNMMQAANDLNLRGVCSAVVIKVKEGTYNASFILKSVPGASSLNTITIESDTSNSNPAKLISGWYTVHLQGASYVSIKGFEIESTRRSPVYLEGANNHVTIEDNHIVNSTKTYSGQVTLNYGLTVWNQSNSPNLNVSLLNNEINGGYGGISYVNSLSANKGLIKGNYITNFRHYGIVASNDYHLTVDGNSIIDSTLNYGNRGTEITNCNVDFTNNRVVINAPSYATGVYIRINRDTNQVRRTIANNAIYVKQTVSASGSSTWGLMLYNSTYQNIYHNSVWMTGGSNSNSRGLVLNSSSHNNLKNNSVVNELGGTALYTTHSTALSGASYNNWWSSGPGLIYNAGSSYTDVFTWRTTTSYGSNSTGANANYMTEFEMRPNHIALDGTADSIPGLGMDINGDSRGNSPDMGAYQFNTRRDDAGVVAIMSKQTCNGTQNVVLAMKNFGGDTLKSVRINWEMSRNGGAYTSQTAYNWVGVLPPGEVDSNVVLGSYSFIGGAYNLRSFTSAPNNKTDELMGNDTLLGAIHVQLRGSYTLGDTASDFVSWNEFASAINLAGVCGPVTINAKAGTYNENILLESIHTLNATNTLTIQSDTGGLAWIADTITPITLRNVQYITIQNLGIRANGNEAALVIDGFDHHLTIDSNQIEGPQSYTNSGSESGIYINSNLSDKITGLTIRGNMIKYGSSGIHFTGGTQNARLKNVDILGNTVQGFYKHGIYSYGIDSVKIEDNAITTSANNSSVGIYMYYNNSFELLRNKLSINSQSAGIGFQMYRCYGLNTQYNHVVNNFIQVAGGTGIDVNNCSYVNYYYNSIHISPNQYSRTAGRVVNGYSSFNVEFTNNSLANTAGGYIYQRDFGFNSNYNNLYTTGQLISQNNVTDLAAWQAGTSKDLNSVSADPIYLSADDLHANQTLMDSAAAILGSFNTDIDGDLRDATQPDIGADEFDLIKNVGVVDVIKPKSLRARKWTSTEFTGNDTIEVVVRNFGPDVVGIPLELQFNGTILQDTIKDTLTAGMLDTFRFPSTINLDTIGTHTLRVFTAMPNDQYIENDTLDIDIVTLANERAKLPYFEGFEEAKDTSIQESYLGLWNLDKWDFNTDGGRLQTRSGKKVSGNQAISLDRTPNGAIKKNELILTLNMSRYDLKDSVYLDFDYIDHRDERHKGDSVWVRGADTVSWVGIYDLWKNRKTNRTKEVRDLEITTVLAAAGQTFSTSFQVKFGQEDNQRLPGDGRTFDNVQVRAVLPYDIAIADASLEFGQVPSDMANNRVHGNISNKGYLTADSVYFNLSIAGITNSFMIDSLVRDQDSTMSITDSIGGQNFGPYQASLFGSFSGSDKCPENDSAHLLFSITDTVLARDNGKVDSTFGFTNKAGQFGTVLEVFEQDTLTSVDFYLNYPTIGDTLRAHVYAMVNDSVSNQLITTNHFIVNSNASRWYTLSIPCMEMLQTGRYLVAVEQTSNNYLTLGITKDRYRKGVSFINQGNGWIPLEDSLDGYVFNIHANFGRYDLPIITAPKTLCLNSNPVVLRSNMKGGKFLGSGILNDTIFNPTLVGYGTHIIKYGLLKSNGCYDTNGIEIFVDSLPVVSLMDQNPVCENAGLTNLSGGLPSGGRYFGAGVIGNRIDPNALGAGIHSIRYRFARPLSGCADTATASIRIKSKPNVLFGQVGDFCANDDEYTLTEGSPAGGNYTGRGIINDTIFNPALAGIGKDTLMYSFTDTNACMDSVSYIVTVNDTPRVNLGPDTSLCPGERYGMSGQSFGSYLWSTGDTTEHYWATTNGVYWLQTTNQFGCVNSDTVTIDFDKNCVGVEELSANGSLIYYPNPTTGLVHLEFMDMAHGKVRLIVRNLQGQEIKTHQWNIESDQFEKSVDLGSLSRGVYYLDFDTPAGRTLEKIVISK